MKAFNKIGYCLIFILVSCGDKKDEKVPDNLSNTNYGYNIIVAFDLSNRITLQSRYGDPEILELITKNLKTLFQKSIDVGINSKFYLTTINDNDFRNFDYTDSVFKIDLTKFKTDAVSRSDYLYHNDTGTNSLKHDIEISNATFSNFYNEIKKGSQLPADMWYFFQDKLDLPIIDTSSFNYVKDDKNITNKYMNYIIVVTDGYIEAGRYGGDQNMQAGNTYRYLSGNLVNEFRDKFNYSGVNDYKEFFRNQQYGIMPVKNDLLKKSKVLVLELNDRSIVNGVTTKTPTDLEILKLFWRDWLVKSGIPERNFVLKEKLANKESLNEIIMDFLEIR